jgi:MFS family permease
MASFAASLGQWMQSTALGWLAFDLTDSRSFVGIVTFMAGVPFLLISLPGGVLIDRFDRRRASP